MANDTFVFTGDTPEEFMSDYDCLDCGLSGYIGKEETPCPRCISAQKHYQRLKEETTENGRKNRRINIG